MLVFESVCAHASVPECVCNCVVHCANTQFGRMSVCNLKHRHKTKEKTEDLRLNIEDTETRSLPVPHPPRPDPPDTPFAVSSLPAWCKAPGAVWQS